MGTLGRGRCGRRRLRRAGTVHADGSAIDTGLFTADGIEPFAPRLAGGMAAIAIGAIAFRWYHRRKHPQLTIDGHRVE